MSQSINSSKSPKTDLDAIANGDKVNPPLNTVSKPRPAEGCVQSRSVKHFNRCQNDGEGAQDRLDTHLGAPLEWELEISDFDFDFTASPGAEEWQIGDSADGCAVYSTVGTTAVGVNVEFQKWDW
ncbi:hypothetical protein FS837_000464 [Tulasnella sp. UAMH 9824]|nr:hypothetical protein FS837_000464 [Tulasnella sp. UAMH 9824]